MPTLAVVTLALACGRAALASTASALGMPSDDLLLASAAMADARWDERAALVWTKPADRNPTRHGVRPSAWYVLDLMARDRPGDRERALLTLRAILQQQIFEPGAAWNGTFFRRPEEPRPRHDARMWHDYDPNWRQFIGCVLAQLLIAYEDRLPPADRAGVEDGIRRAVEGELAEGRLQPSYTNIALMHGFLLSFAGARLDRPEWVKDGEAWLESVHAEFAPHGSFAEFNSPTYYGVDLYGLALLRRHGVTAQLRRRGAEMEAALWNDIARFYHAGLRNLAGPFDRTYGMDMRRYVSLLGVWLGLVLPEHETPLPPVSQSMDHGGDFFFVPCFTLLGAEIPAEARPHFSRFEGERQLTRPIADGRRVATAWLDRDIMIGAEATALSRDVRDPDSQFRPATIHWRTPTDEVGWIAVCQSSRIDAHASRHTLAISAIGDCTFRIQAAEATVTSVARERWALPGLYVAVETDARSFSVRPGPDFIDVVYSRATRFTLRTEVPARSLR